MDCSLPPAAWELPPPPGEGMEGELGSLEEVEAAFAEPSPAASSLGSWADECEGADAALATAESSDGAGMPRGESGGRPYPRRGLAEGGGWGVVGCAESGHCAAATAAGGSQGSAAEPARGP